jgi:Kef-type K+ transport system membrane component KefB
MNEHDLVIFLLQLATMLAGGLLFGQLMRLLRLPVVVGEVTAGILLGPTVLGTLLPEAHGWLFPSSGVTAAARSGVLNVGLILFLFIAGLELNLAQLRGRNWGIVSTSLAGIVVPFALGFGVVLLLPGFWGQQQDLQLFALFLGTALSISALPIIARIMLDLGLIKSELGTLVIAAAIVDDLIGWSLFAAILSQLAGENSRNPLFTLLLVGALFLLMLTFGRRAARRAMSWLRVHTPWPATFIAGSGILVLLASAGAEWLGIHAVFGAFLVGALRRAVREQRAEAQEIFHQFVLNLLAPLYFVSIGLRVNFAANFDLGLVLLIILIACVGKIGGASLGAWLARLPARQALAVGFGMNARGAMEIILASVALEYGLIDERIFVALVVMALVTSVLSGPMIQRLHLGYSRSEPGGEPFAHGLPGTAAHSKVS